jgi:hypothetical protein
VLIEELSGHPPVDMEGALSDIGWRAMSLVGVGSAAGIPALFLSMVV